MIGQYLQALTIFTLVSDYIDSYFDGTLQNIYFGRGHSAENNMWDRGLQTETIDLPKRLVSCGYLLSVSLLQIR